MGTGLRLAVLFLREIIVPSLSHVQPDLASKLNQLRTLAKSCQPSSFAFLRQLVQITMIGFDAENAADCALVCHFVRRYVQEIIFGEQEGFLHLGTSEKEASGVAPDADLIRALEWMVNGSPAVTIDPSAHILP